MRNKTTDVSGDFEPPEENKAPVRRRLTTKTSVPPVIRAVPVNPAPAPAVQATYIGEEIDLASRRKSYWSKLNKYELDTALERLGIPKETTVNVRGQVVKQAVDKINKKTMLEMIYKKLNM